MSLDGLRAWIGEVERKLGARTRVFLVLVAIAIGAGGAGVYLALDAQDSQVSEADLQAAREELLTEIGAQAAAGAEDPRVEQLEREVEDLQRRLDGEQGGKGASSPPGDGGTGGAPSGASDSAEGAAGSGAAAGVLDDLKRKAEEKAK